MEKIYNFVLINQYKIFGKLSGKINGGIDLRGASYLQAHETKLKFKESKFKIISKY